MKVVYGYIYEATHFNYCNMQFKVFITSGPMFARVNIEVGTSVLLTPEPKTKESINILSPPQRRVQIGLDPSSSSCD